MTRRTLQFADASDMLNIPPTRAKETTFREKTRLSREYINLVLRPARFNAFLLVKSGAMIMGGMFYIIAVVGGNPQPWPVYAVATSVGAGFGAALAVANFWWLHTDYADVPATIEETTREHELDQPVVERREVPVTRNGERAGVIQVNPRQLGRVTFTPSQIDAMQQRADDDGRLARDTGGWSGSQYNAVRDELARREYVTIEGNGCAWTQAGIDWLMG